MLPTFIIAGAGKSGTTSLWNYLKAHPEICMARIKEPGFFTKSLGRDQGRGENAPSRSGKFDKGFPWYESLFINCQGKKAFGEASTMYMYSEDAPTLMKRYIPDVKLIFLLRDPVDRAYSQYWQEKKTGWDLPDFDIIVSQQHPRLSNYLENSSYKKHLQRYFDCFPQEQIMILLFEDLIQDALETFNKVSSFIGVRSDFVPPNIHEKFNVAAQSRWLWLQRVMRVLSDSPLKEKIPSLFMSILNYGNHRLIKWNRVPRQYEPMSYGVRSKLITELMNDIEFVESLLQVSLGHWKT